MRAVKSGAWVLALVLASAALSRASQADEGMWTYDSVPVRKLQERYGFTPSPQWLEHLRLSSVNMYASASFVSRDGLILTNHHVALGSAQRLSTPDRNLVRDGFCARSVEEEIPVPSLSVRVLVSMEDVTARLEAAVGPGATPAQAQARRAAAAAALSAECRKATGFEGDVVTLYGGAKSFLYRYKEYSDVRLAFIPEMAAAFFGGDDDNFTYPRYDLDMALLRAYENGKPARVEHFFRVNPAGASEGDLVFVSGHPGRTDRLKTYAMLEYYRDVTFPARLARAREVRALLGVYSARGPEEARRARTYLYFVENSLKAGEGEYRGLQDPALMATKLAREKALRDAVAKDPALAPYAGAWDEVAASLAWAREHEKDRLCKTSLGERGLAGVAVQLVRYATEAAKPDADRLEGFHEAQLPDLLRRLQAPAPYFRDLDEAMLAFELAKMVQGLGPGDPYVRVVLGGESPEAFAKKVLAGSRLADAAVRAALLKNRGRGVLRSADPLIELARRADPTMRETERLFREKVEAVEEEALTRVAKAGFAVYGGDAYPDATRTLRLAFGAISGYPFARRACPPSPPFTASTTAPTPSGRRATSPCPPRPPPTAGTSSSRPPSTSSAPPTSPGATRAARW